MEDRTTPPEPVSDDAEAPRFGWGGEVGGLLLVVLSVIFVTGGWQLGLGVPTRLGTGAFPFLTGAVLAVLAVFICIAERRGSERTEAPDWLALTAIVAALAIFALTVDRIGLIPGVFATVVVASFPDRSLSFPGKGLLGIYVAIACWLIFIEVLNLPFKPIVGL